MENNIVSRIRTLANAQGLSLTNLEIKLSLGNGTISRWVKSSPNSDKLARVADYFHVTTDYLLGRTSPTDSEYTQLLTSLQKPVSASFSGDSWKADGIGFASDEDLAAQLCASKGMKMMILSPDEHKLLQKFRCLDARGQSAVLNVLEHEYASLPGDNTAPSPKEA